MTNFSSSFNILTHSQICKYTDTQNIPTLTSGTESYLQNGKRAHWLKC